MLTLALLAAVGLVLLNQKMQDVMATPNTISAPMLFEVPAGSTLASIAGRIAVEGWVEDERFVEAYARVNKLENRLQAGIYEVSPGLTPAALLDKIVRGTIKHYEVRFIEGTNYREVLATLNASEGIVTTIDSNDPATLVAALGLAVQHPEGQFFPASYRYSPGTTDVEILNRAQRKMQQVLAAAWHNKASDLPYASPYEALIMASIIEKETGQASERSEIAGVFVRRLRKGMKLQTDPTVIYGLGESFDGNLTRKHLTSDTPYNTYTRHGLPPGPIALAGEAAIHAALNPKAGQALYFVAKGDGSHYFSKTLSEHQRAVRKYQLGID